MEITINEPGIKLTVRMMSDSSIQVIATDLTYGSPPSSYAHLAGMYLGVEEMRAQFSKMSTANDHHKAAIHARVEALLAWLEAAAKISPGLSRISKSLADLGPSSWGKPEQGPIA